MPPRARRGLWLAIFAACVLAAGAKAIAVGKDANWDLKNYHWYNAWALLNGRLGWDLAPAQIQTYYNPIGDLPFYFLVQWLPWPRHVAFWMALSTAVAVFFLLRIAALLFPVGRERGALVWVAAAGAIGATGAAGQATIGSTMNEWLCAAPLMAGLFLVVRALVEGEDVHRRSFAVAAFLVGCAVGVKLTYAVFGVAFLVALATYVPPHVPLLGGPPHVPLLGGPPHVPLLGGPMRARRVVVAGAFMAAGALVFGGYWAWVMWREFANPTFPYYNHVFDSPWWEPVAFFDRNYGPRDALQAIFFPLYFSHRSTLVSEVGFRDYRLAALMVLGVLCLVKALLLPSREKAGMRVEWRFLATFTVVAYLIWLKLFGIYRYLVPLELLSGPLIVGCLLFLLQGRVLRYVAVGVLAALLLGTTRPMSWGRIPFGHEYFEVKVPALEPGALVIVGYSHPMSYVIPFFPADTRFVSPANNFLMPDQGNLLARRAADLIRAHRGPIYLLEYRARVQQDEATLKRFGLEFDAAPCEGIRSTFSDNFMQVCRLSRS